MIFKSSSRFYGPLLQAKLETTVYTFYDPLDYCQPPLLDSPDRRDFSHWTRKEKKSSPNPVRRKIRSLFHFENPWELIRAAEYGVHSGLKSVKKMSRLHFRAKTKFPLIYNSITLMERNLKFY